MILSDGYSDVPAGKVAAIVTYLEMAARPTLPPDPVGTWTLRKVTRPGLDWFRELYLRVGSEWLWFARISMADPELAARIQSPQVDVHALVFEGRDEGLLELDFRETGACEIGMFGVTAKLIGTGAARWLMNRALELAWAQDSARNGPRNVERVWLHTCTFDHPAALPFYRRAGFRPFRRQIVVGDDPRLNGIAPGNVAPHIPIIA